MGCSCRFTNKMSRNKLIHSSTRTALNHRYAYWGDAEFYCLFGLSDRLSALK
jgi:hypothetical protein